MKAIIYTRGGNKSGQIEKCEEYAKTNGITVIEEVSTENELSDYILNEKTDAIIVHDATRVSRDRKEYMFTEFMLQQLGIKLLLVEGN